MWVRKMGEGEGSVYVRIKLSEHEGVAERKRKKAIERLKLKGRNKRG